jgi:glycosyltransferase involved in cell wall biosynthesis
MRPLVSLVMMIKDEAKSLRGVLEAVKPFVDRWTIVDTGSRDDSCRIVKEVMVSVPGWLHHEQFRGYAATRNRVLDLDAQVTDPSEFSLFLSGDEYLRDGAKLREYLETQRDTNVDCHFIRLALDMGMSMQARVLRTGSKWRYDDFDLGIHEVPVYPGGADAPKGASPGGYIEHVAADPIARMDNIWEKHIPLLRAALERNPKNERALEFLISSLESFLPHMETDECKDTVEECLELYRQRFELPFVCEEQRRIFVMRMIDTARLGDSFTPEELFIMADKLCQADASRPEPFFLRAVIASTCPSKLTSDVYSFAREATVVAEKVRGQGGLTNSSPLDMSTEWKAHRLAAIAAANLAKKYPENLSLAKDHIAAGLAVGGPWMAFKSILDAEATP